ncbi:MAG: hypothetical protein GW893_03100 [Armatimonadetes bacterium]|nr:hypothetical protein [Armatimonadota bacterium]PIY44056.1 MAG: hypothetical protein COZ05_09340 [Armatimonadetes bacterium CG_4_10_14_3_um_filter_59_10]
MSALLRGTTKTGAFLIVAWVVLTGRPALPQTGLSVQPPWQTQSAKVFTVKDGAIFADGEPFPLNFEFTWSSNFTEPFFKYASQFLNTVHYEPVSLGVGGQQNFKELNQHYTDAARHRVYCCVGLSVASARSYVGKYPEAAMRGPDGKPASEGRVSYLDAGYREALRESLKSLAVHVRDLPFHFG